MCGLLRDSFNDFEENVNDLIAGYLCDKKGYIKRNSKDESEVDKDMGESPVNFIFQ